MPWLYLLLAAAAFAIAFQADSVAVVVACLLVACVATLGGALGLLAQRVGRRSRDETSLIDPVELQRLREQAETRRLAAADGGVAGESHR
jgi:hypothetical protein